jgi:hypothetical protein
MELFGGFVLFCVGAILSRVSSFFLNAIESNVDLFHLASFDSGWEYSVTRDLMLMSLRDIALAMVFVLATGWVIWKLSSLRLTSSRAQLFATIVGAVVSAWFWPNS